MNKWNWSNENENKPFIHQLLTWIYPDFWIENVWVLSLEINPNEPRGDPQTPEQAMMVPLKLRTNAQG